MNETKLVAGLLPSAAPSEEEAAAWARLSRAEQIERTRLLLSQADAKRHTAESPEKILEAARNLTAKSRS